jgi:serine/threonine-protein kinase
MAPEIILEGDVDERADVYALGCVAYYMLTGTHVFEADTPMKMFVQHLQTPPVPPSARTDQPIPRELDELVLACLAKDRHLRPQNAHEVLRLVDRCLPGVGWDGAAASEWWEEHLAELTLPLAVTSDQPTVETLLVPR